MGLILDVMEKFSAFPATLFPAKAGIGAHSVAPAFALQLRRPSISAGSIKPVFKLDGGSRWGLHATAGMPGEGKDSGGA